MSMNTLAILKTHLEVLAATTFAIIQYKIYGMILSVGFISERIKNNVEDIKNMLGLGLTSLLIIYYIIKVINLLKNKNKKQDE